VFGELDEGSYRPWMALLVLPCVNLEILQRDWVSGDLADMFICTKDRHPVDSDDEDDDNEAYDLRSYHPDPAANNIHEVYSSMRVPY
jgi:hypothetical protein